MDITSKYTDLQAINDLKDCTVCPRSCHVNRAKGELGYCKTNSDFNISSICIHKGEEPVIAGKSGIVNVFFAHCNLQCIFCQNHQISQNGTRVYQFGTLEQITEEIISLFATGCTTLGFVSASHMVPQMVLIINELHRKGWFPTIVYNSNGYDNVNTLRKLEGLIDIYLPDFKYSNHSLSKLYSDSANYTDVAIKALKEMYRQMGPVVITNEDETAVRGMIVRHLVLPGQIENSIEALRIIADELSVKLTISLMAQYSPVREIEGFENLNRNITPEEYNAVISEMEKLGFSSGWIQDIESNKEYIPDFNLEHPFEKTG